MKKIKKRYSIMERYNYHNSRDRSPGRFGIKMGDPKNSYSAGFVDAFHGVNNSYVIRSEFGKHSARAYDRGRRVGVLAAKKYSNNTGKPSFTIEY